MKKTPGILILMVLCAGGAAGFDIEDCEEPAGATFTILGGPDGVYGAAFGRGTRLKGAPVFGDLFATLLQNDIESAFYAGIGLTIRLMPAWEVAPFTGAGGTFNYGWPSRSNDEEADVIPAEATLQHAGEPNSYWTAHVEGGIRWHLCSGTRLIELLARHSWSSSGAGADHWIFGLGFGSKL